MGLPPEQAKKATPTKQRTAHRTACTARCGSLYVYAPAYAKCLWQCVHLNLCVRCCWRPCLHQCLRISVCATGKVGAGKHCVALRGGGGAKGAWRHPRARRSCGCVSPRHCPNVSSSPSTAQTLLCHFKRCLQSHLLLLKNPAGLFSVGLFLRCDVLRRFGLAGFLFCRVFRLKELLQLLFEILFGIDDVSEAPKRHHMGSAGGVPELWLQMARPSLVLTRTGFGRFGGRGLCLVLGWVRPTSWGWLVNARKVSGVQPHEEVGITRTTCVPDGYIFVRWCNCPCFRRNGQSLIVVIQSQNSHNVAFAVHGVHGGGGVGASNASNQYN